MVSLDADILKATCPEKVYIDFLSVKGTRKMKIIWLNYRTSCLQFFYYKFKKNDKF